MSNDICCERFQEGCARGENDREFIGGQCIADDCSTCELEYHTAVNYYSATDMLLQRVVDYENLLTPFVNDKA